MRPVLRLISEKYKAQRLQEESLFDSRTFQTLFNKFMVRGNKLRSRRHIMTALAGIRLAGYARPTFPTLLSCLWNIRIFLTTLRRRKGRQMLPVPAPVRRNKRDVLSIQFFSKFTKQRTERSLWQRVVGEFNSLVLDPLRSAIIKARDELYRILTAERANIGMRWK